MKNTHLQSQADTIQSKLIEIQDQEVSLSAKPYASMVREGNPSTEALIAITDTLAINGKKSLFSSVSWFKILLLALLAIILAAGDGYLVKQNVETNFGLDPAIASLLATLALAMSVVTTHFMKSPLIEFHTKRSSRSKRLVSFIIGLTVTVFVLIILGVGFFAEESAKKNDADKESVESLNTQTGWESGSNDEDLAIPTDESIGGLAKSTVDNLGLVFTMLLTLGFYLILIFLETYLVIFFQMMKSQRLDAKLVKRKDELLERISIIRHAAPILEDLERNSQVVQNQVSYLHILPADEELQNHPL